MVEEMKMALKTLLGMVFLLNGQFAGAQGPDNDPLPVCHIAYQEAQLECYTGSPSAIAQGMIAAPMVNNSANSEAPSEEKAREIIISQARSGVYQSKVCFTKASVCKSSCGVSDPSLKSDVEKKYLSQCSGYVDRSKLNFMNSYMTLIQAGAAQLSNYSSSSSCETACLESQTEGCFLGGGTPSCKKIDTHYICACNPSDKSQEKSQNKPQNKPAISP